MYKSNLTGGPHVWRWWYKAFQSWSFLLYGSLTMTVGLSQENSLVFLW